MHRAAASLIVSFMVILAGCGGRRSSLLLERPAAGPLDVVSTIGQARTLQLDPAQLTKTDRDIEILVEHATPQYLQNLFSNREIFRQYAGRSPFFPENLVFYVKIANKSNRRIQIAPHMFVLVDDLGNQYSPMGVDYLTAFEEFRSPVSTTTRGMLSGASPGYFGVSVPVGKMFSGKPQGQFALLKRSSLQAGSLYPGVIYDGLLAFWTPSVRTKKLRLLLSGIKTDFDASDLPQTSLDMPFDFTVTAP